MVFCYKIITETPRRRSGSVSPRKMSPSRLPELISLVDKVDKTFDSDLLDAIPDREWKFLDILLRKRTQDVEREKFANDFRRLWEREKRTRDLLAAETSQQYRRYLQKKREEDYMLHSFRVYERHRQEKLRRSLLTENIRFKEQRSAQMMNWYQDIKTRNLIDKAIDHEAKLVMAADKKCRQETAEEWRKRMELEDKARRLDEAQRKREALIRDTAKKVAISNALSHWETMMLKQEAEAEDTYKRAQYAAHAELTTLRSMELAQARQRKHERARRAAALTRQLRDILRATSPIRVLPT